MAVLDPRKADLEPVEGISLEKEMLIFNKLMAEGPHRPKSVVSAVITHVAPLPEGGKSKKRVHANLLKERGHG